MIFQVMGGDERQQHLARYIKEKGFTVYEKIKEQDPPPRWDADILILPLPVSKDQAHLFMPFCKEPYSIEEVGASFQGRLIFGGMLPRRSYPCPAIDYYKNEGLLWSNAALTAEGAIGLAVGSTPFSLWGTPVLVLGAGRIGRILAMELKALGANVLVGVRRQESADLCRAMGIKARLYEDLPLGKFPLVFNTVPARVLERERLKRLPKGAYLIELASSPFGFDKEEAAEEGLIPIGAAGLPGRYSPKTAAELIGEIIIKEMENFG